ncbi:MAG: hypothetical protein ACYDER_01480 [Ktedonobacteraceae bacterium]
MENNNDNNVEFLLEEPLRELGVFLAKAEKPILARQWIEADIMRVYVRKSRRILEGQPFACLDIATIDVEEEYQHQGLFKTFVTKAHELNPFRRLVLNMRKTPLLKNGVKQMGGALSLTHSLHLSTYPND